MAQFDEFRSFIRRDAPLAMHTRLQLGGPAEFFAEPTSEEELRRLLQQSQVEHVPVRMLGMGANVLASEEGVSGVVIRLTAPAFCGITVDDRRVIAGAGAKLGRVITQSVASGLAGLEGLIGIPGTIGGALCENTGTNSGDIGQWVESVTVMGFDGTTSVLSKNEISFEYQTSSLDDVVVVSATFLLERDDPAELARRMQKLWIVRKSRQPAGELVSTFAFKNPRSGTSAGDLIEKAGLKGTRIGGASISERNANFILVEPEGTVDDVLRLIELVRREVESRTEIELEPAVAIW